MAEIITEADAPTLNEPSEQSLRRLRWLATGCLIIGAAAIFDSLYQALFENSWEAIDPAWFLVGAAGGLLNGRSGWRTVVLVVSWLLIVIGTISACFSFWETYLLSQANIPGYALLHGALGGFCMLALALLATWSIRLLRQQDLKQNFPSEKPLSPPLSRKIKWTCWISALLFCALLPASDNYWQKHVVKRERWHQTQPFIASDDLRLRAVEVLYQFGRTQELLLWNGKGKYSRTHHGSGARNDSPFTSIDLPNGRNVTVPGKANIFEIIDGEYREAFLEITQEETEALLNSAKPPLRIEGVEKFIAELRKNSSKTP